jgi:hypothetical protein
MKKWIMLSTLLTLASFTAQAQYDDIYYDPSRDANRQTLITIIMEMEMVRPTKIGTTYVMRRQMIANISSTMTSMMTINTHRASAVSTVLTVDLATMMWLIQIIITMTRTITTIFSVQQASQLWLAMAIGTVTTASTVGTIGVGLTVIGTTGLMAATTGAGTAIMVVLATATLITTSTAAVGAMVGIMAGVMAGTMVGATVITTTLIAQIMVGQVAQHRYRAILKAHIRVQDKAMAL